MKPLRSQLGSTTEHGSSVPILIGAMVIGTILRLYDLGEFSLWLDEIRSLTHAAGITSLGIAFDQEAVLRTGDAHPPLYFLLLKLWLPVGTGPFALRFPSAMIGVLTIAATFLLGREVISRRAAVLAAILVAASPLLLLYDREVRMYPLFGFLAVLTVYLFLRAHRTDSLRYWVGFSVVAVFNLYTHYHAVLVLASIWVWLILIGERRRRVWLRFLTSQVFVALMFVPWLAVLSAQFERFFTAAAANPRFPSIWGKIVDLPYLVFSFAVGQTVLPWNFWVVIPAATAFTGITWVGARTVVASKEKFRFFLAFLVWPVVLGFFITNMLPRYFAFVFPVFALFIAEGISHIDSRRIRIGTVLVVAIVWSVSLLNYYGGREFHILAHTDPWREVGAFIRDNRSDNDLLIASGSLRVVDHHTGFRGLSAGDSPAHPVELVDGQRLWYVLSTPRNAEEGEETLSVLTDRFDLRLEERFGHDPHFATKERFFTRRFFEYRIRVFLFEGPGSARDSP